MATVVEEYHMGKSHVQGGTVAVLRCFRHNGNAENGSEDVRWVVVGHPQM